MYYTSVKNWYFVLNSIEKLVLFFNEDVESIIFYYLLLLQNRSKSNLENIHCIKVDASNTTPSAKTVVRYVEIKLKTATNFKKLTLDPVHSSLRNCKILKMLEKVNDVTDNLSVKQHLISIVQHLKKRNLLSLTDIWCCVKLGNQQPNFSKSKLDSASLPMLLITQF